VTKREVRRIVGQWIVETRSKHLGYQGCFLNGSINSLSEMDPIHDNSDIDLTIVIDETIEKIIGVPKRQYYQGVLIEPALCPKSWFDDRDGILKEPNYACHLAADCVIDDKENYLHDLHHYAELRYGLPENTEARCRRLSERLLSDSMTMMTDSKMETMKIIGHTNVVSSLAQIILLAHLQIPTYRKCLLWCRDYLKKIERIDLYDRIMHLLIGASFSEDDVCRFYEDVLWLYHKALTVKREPFLGDFYIYPEFMGLVANTADEFLKGGNAREGVLWMLDLQAASLIAIEQSETDRDKLESRIIFRKNLNRIGIHDQIDYQDKAIEARCILDEIMTVAVGIICTQRIHRSIPISTISE
jgi:hypothetical protein